MSQREDLERLASVCETCALVYAAGIDDHLYTCSSCMDHLKKADEIERAHDRMVEVSPEPELQRRHHLGFDFNDLVK